MRTVEDERKTKESERKKKERERKKGSIKEEGNEGSREGERTSLATSCLFLLSEGGESPVRYENASESKGDR